MKTGILGFTTIGLAIIGAACWLGSPAVLGHGGGGHGYMGGGGVYFDSTTVTTLSGTLSEPFDDWEMWGNGNHTGGGMHFELNADGGKKYDLMLGPYWYLEENGIVLSAGESVSVTGSVVEPYGPGFGHMGGGHMGGGGDEDYLIVQTLTAGGITLQLRDAEGYPIWRGGPGWDGTTWFDPDTVTSMRGSLRDNLGLWSCWGEGNYTGNGMHYLFDSKEGETFYTMLGPWWYLEEEGLTLNTSEPVKLKGSVVDSYWDGYDDYRYLITTEISQGGKTVRLRDNYGYPLWHGTGWHYYSPAYDTNETGSVTGTVVRSRTRTHGRELDPGFELVLKAGGKRYIVYVAPKWHADGIGFAPAKGREMTVSGAMVARGKKTDIVARRIVVDGKSWRFRSANGSPLWIEGAK